MVHGTVFLRLDSSVKTTQTYPEVVGERDQGVGGPNNRYVCLKLHEKVCQLIYKSNERAEPEIPITLNDVGGRYMQSRKPHPLQREQGSGHAATIELSP